MLSTDKFLCFSSLFWVTGLTILIQGTIQNVTRIITEGAYNPEDFFDIVERYKVSIMLSPPSSIAMSLASDKLKECDLSSIEVYLAGGSAVPHAIVEKFKPFAPNAKFITGCAPTEIVTFISYGEIDSKNSIGQLNVNTEVKIVSINDGTNQGVSEIGEICIRTKFPWAGYVDNPEATKSCYEQDGWYHTGDVGYFDKSGCLYIVDRIKEILKYNNFHFYPSEIERVINELPDVAVVCVVGIPDIVSTYLPAAAVVKLPNSSLSEEEIYQHVVNRMEHFERLLGGVYFFDSLPQTASGKTLRRKVAEICENISKEKCLEKSIEVDN